MHSSCSIRDFRLQTQRIAADRDEQVERASGALETVENGRLSRADVFSRRYMVEEVKNGLTRLKSQNDISEL